MRVPVNLMILLVLLAGIVFLQIFLSKRESKWPGLVLPGLTFLWSLVLVLNVATFASMAHALLTILLVFAAGNIPTAVLLAIYFSCREKFRKRNEMDKMQINDL